MENALTIKKPSAVPGEKPRLRGVSHQIAALITLVAGSGLVLMAPGARATWGASAYVFSLLSLFAISAFYHRPTWQPRQRRILRRFDHSAIFLLIAGSYTPIILLVFPVDRGGYLLSLVWGGALLGIGQSIFWPGAPKALVALLCIALGWVVVLDWDMFRDGLTVLQLLLIALGGVLYTGGAMIYAMRRPDPWPDIFGYHEVFHALTIAATACHAYAITEIIMSAG